MIGLDTNILARYFLQDDPIQSPKAIEIVEGRLSRDRRGYISLPVIAELSWLLLRHYRLSDAEVAAIFKRMVAADVFCVQNEREVILATEALATGEGDFADALIGALNVSAGCRVTLTFDRGAARLPGFIPA